MRQVRLTWRRAASTLLYPRREPPPRGTPFVQDGERLSDLRTTNPRFAKAEGILGAAEASARAGFWDSAVSRSYYASFHAAVVYLQETHGGRPAKSGRWGHDYVSKRFRQRSGAPEGLLLRRLYQARTVADYQTRTLEEEDARKAIDHAKRIVEFVEKSVTSRTSAGGHAGVP